MADCKWKRLADGSHVCPDCGATRPAGRPAPRRRCPIASPSRGLGDTIAKLAKRLAIPLCRGCNRRRRWLNRLFPYLRNL